MKQNTVGNIDYDLAKNGSGLCQPKVPVRDLSNHVDTKNKFDKTISTKLVELHSE